MQMTISQLRTVHSRAIVRRRDWKATSGAVGRDAAIALENTLIRQSRQMVADRIEKRRIAAGLQ